MVKAYNGRGDVENRIKEGKNTLRWDKTSCHRFAANQARLLMGVLAYNLLPMLRQFYLMGEESQTVNGMAHQASDESRSESVVSRSEVVCPRGVGVSLGPILPSCLRVTSVVEEIVDRVPEGVVRSETGQKGLFYQRDDGFAWVRPLGNPNGDLFGVSGVTSQRPKGAGKLQWQDRRIIPVQEGLPV